MAEVMESNCKHEYASNAKANAGLTTGIIGTSLAGLLTLGAMSKGEGLLGGILGGKPIAQTYLMENSTMREKRLRITLN